MIQSRTSRAVDASRISQTPMAAGFTLIELSVVLVIIGLIVGGVLVGQSLVHSAQLNKAISQIRSYQTAATTFKEKYSYLPGDLPNAANFGLTAPASAACGSNLGNGLIDDAYCFNPPTTISGESSLFWVHLSGDTHLIEGAYVYSGPATGGVFVGTTIPLLAVGGGIAVQQDGQGQNWFGTGIISESGVPYSFVNPGMIPYDALAIDQKIDDGLPNSGKVQGSPFNTGGGINIVGPMIQWNTGCATDGTWANTPAARYNTQGASSNTPQCNLRIQLQVQ